MNKKRIAKLISFLIIVFFIFQLMPGNSTYVGGFHHHAQNSKVFLTSSSINADALYIGRVNQKTSLQKVQIKNTSISVHQICIAETSLINSLLKKELFDQRKAIRQSIPDYFNGSKYKNYHFTI